MNERIDYWPTIGALGAIIDCLPPGTQKRIAEQLQVLARVQERKGLLTASYFSRALSGELSGEQPPFLGLNERRRTVLRLVK